MKPASRKQMRAAIQSKGIEAALSVPKGTLTKKQRAFAEAMAAGETGAAAYRMAYDTQASPHSQSNDATRLKRHPVISQQIEALRLANEAMKYADAASIRQLVIQSLIQTVIDPDVKHATKVQAAKVLGSVTEIAAFTERKEITHVESSAALREQIMQQLKTVILDTDNAETVDAESLLADIAGEKMSEDGDPTAIPCPDSENEPHLNTLHTIPLKRSQDFSQDSPIAYQTEQPTPIDSENDNTGGYISSQNDDLSK